MLPGFVWFWGRSPGVLLHIHARLEKSYAFAFQKFALQTGIWLTDQQFSFVADHAMPGNTFAGGACGHCMASTAGSSAEPKSLGKSAVGDNPSARDPFDEGVDGSPGLFPVIILLFGLLGGVFHLVFGSNSGLK